MLCVSLVRFAPHAAWMFTPARRSCKQACGPSAGCQGTAPCRGVRPCRVSAPAVRSQMGWTCLTRAERTKRSGQVLHVGLDARQVQRCSDFGQCGLEGCSALGCQQPLPHPSLPSWVRPGWETLSLLHTLLQTSSSGGKVRKVDA